MPISKDLLYIVIFGLLVVTITSCSTSQHIGESSNKFVMELILIRDADNTDSANWHVDGMLVDRPYRFVLDTGAGMTVFNLDFIKKHPEIFKRVGRSVGTDSSGAKSETPAYEMKGFVLGRKQFPPTRVVGVDLSVPNSTIRKPMDFILGYPVLRQANWYFDFRNKKWRIIKMLQEGRGSVMVNVLLIPPTRGCRNSYYI